MQMLYKYYNGKPEPELLVSENFNEFDVAKFRVINGCWDELVNCCMIIDGGNVGSIKV